MGRIYLLMGKSASGKDSLRREILKRLPELKTYTPYTTRPIREGETPGDEYHFVDEDKLRQYALEGRLVESRTYTTEHGPWSYATVDDGELELTRDSILMEGTLESYEALRRYFGDGSVVPLYIEIDDEERYRRALKREKSESCPRYAELERRFAADSEDFSENKLSLAGITQKYRNDKLNDCAEAICERIRREEASRDFGDERDEES